MKNFNRLLLSTILSLIIINSAFSSTFYVNVNTGSDANSPAQAKNIATPWKTVQFAINNAAVVNGDNVVIAEGVYAGFDLTKRLNIIGVWKGVNTAQNTIFNSGITLSAPGGNSASRMFLKNFRITISSGTGIDIRESFVTIENVSASGTNGVRFNSTFIRDVAIQFCNLNDNDRAGIFFPTFATVDGFSLRNSTVNNNGYFGILALQTSTNPTEIKNVEITNCSFVDNNPTNQVQGHAIYFEKLKNASINRVSVVTPLTNQRIGININLLSRDDYSKIFIQNTRIIRATPGSGIWIQARNDLNYPPAKLDTVTVRGVTFSNCDTNLAFNRQVKNMTVDKCDLSTYLAYGLINFTDQGGTIDASNNKWQNGAAPDATIISAGAILTGSPVISSMPSTNGIINGMGIVGPGIPPGTTVLNISPTAITMSSNATATGFLPQIGFAFGSVTSTDIVRTSLNFILTANPLPNSIVNDANVSFPTLASAISGTSAGNIFNVPSGLISGTTVVGNGLRLISPGTGFLHSGSLTTFQNLTVNNIFYMGSDFAVDGNLNGGTVSIGNGNTFIINGNVVSGRLEANLTSNVFIGGTGPSTILPPVVGSLNNFQINRPNGISLSSPVNVRTLLFLQFGTLFIGNNDLTLENNASVFKSNQPSAFVATNGTGKFRKSYISTSVTAFNFTVGNGNYSPVRVFLSDLSGISGTSFLNVRDINSKHPQNQCGSDYLNRYWTITESGLTGISSDLLFGYNVSDVSGNETNIYGARWDGFSWTTFTPVNTSTHTFTINGITGFGDFSGGGINCIGNFQTQINVKIILEGAYAGNGLMRTDLFDEGIIPTSQPYNTNPFNYNGTESVSSIPADVVDWVYLEIRTIEDGAPVSNGQRAAFVKSDGTVVDLDGISPVKINVISGSYFIVVGHRNHLPVMSSAKALLNTSSQLYNFTTGYSKYYGNDAADLGNGVFGMYGGDANRTFLITASDYFVVTNNLGQTDYNYGDLNLTAIVSASDYFVITQNLGKGSNVPNYD